MTVGVAGNGNPRKSLIVVRLAGIELASESRKIDQHVDAKGAPNLRATSQIVFSSLILHSFSSRQL